jgi:ribosomal protein S18 acetylase RimI-like enzyme
MPNADIVITTATLDDVDTIVDFNRRMAHETEHIDLPLGVVRRGVRGAFDQPARARYFIARRDGAPVGQMMITTEWSDWRNGDFWWIQSVYVPPEARRQGVYRALHQHVQLAARATPGVCGLRLYVETSNATAQSVYRAMGMDERSYRMFEVDWSSDA